jgi:ubiquinone/menaquinone biosynthesis C-methylase UbiE
MTATDSLFAGSIPGLYHRYLGPLLFQPYAEEVARRALRLSPQRILETAAGTGIVTAELHRALPDAEIVATDLNPAMLELAAEHVSSDKVGYQAADALDLPFADASFDLVVCQFGAMFYPDKVAAIAKRGGCFATAANISS